MSTRISQREARRLRKQIAVLNDAAERQRRVWGQEWVNGVEIARIAWEPTSQTLTAIRTARKLGHAVVAVGDESGLVRFVALPHPKVTS